jgi:3-hydroxyisobutyrate dehydrogenase
MKVACADFQPGFAIVHMLKDLRLVSEVIAAEKLSLSAIALASQIFERVGSMEGGLEQGTQAAIRAYRTPADMDV